MFDSMRPFNELPSLPPAVLKKAIAASRALADVKGMAERMPSQAMLIDSLGLLNLPMLYLSRYIIDHKPARYEGLRQVTEEGAWGDSVLYMLDAVERTSVHTRQQITRILALMETVRERVRPVRHGRKPKVTT